MIDEELLPVPQSVPAEARSGENREARQRPETADEHATRRRREAATRRGLHAGHMVKKENEHGR